MYCHYCGKEFQPWVEVNHYTDSRGFMPVMVYEYCDWKCESSGSHFCINCGKRIVKDRVLGPYLCKMCEENFDTNKKVKFTDLLKLNYLYFFQLADKGYIKIGISKNPFNRLKQIQTNNPYKIIFLGVMKNRVGLERKIHKLFNKSRGFGEWFKLTQKLKNFIKRETFNLDAKDLLL